MPFIECYPRAKRRQLDKPNRKIAASKGRWYGDRATFASNVLCSFGVSALIRAGLQRASRLSLHVTQAHNCRSPNLCPVPSAQAHQVRRLLDQSQRAVPCLYPCLTHPHSSCCFFESRSLPAATAPCHLWLALCVHGFPSTQNVLRCSLAGLHGQRALPPRCTRTQ